MKQKRWVDRNTLLEARLDEIAYTLEERIVYAPGESGSRRVVKSEKRVYVRRLMHHGKKDKLTCPTSKTIWSSGWGKMPIMNALLVAYRIEEDIKNGTYRKHKRYS